ncbi:MAG: translation initiation factor IF-2 [SAR202 cluster bacterium]|nr:translation initiation factor IF-2 [SAR202 cluster bacterium]|tara:strand:+ start:9039 stop:10802 length:1764 start_codon:yes stop_codon:yes gene_type:complete
MNTKSSPDGITKKLNLPSAISVSDLSELLDVNPVEIVKELMRGGYMFAVNDVIEYELASIVSQVYGFKTDLDDPDNQPITSIALNTSEEDPDQLVERPPIVTILGHVDHGKTTLLDKIREANVVEGEAGGITQHIGAYQIKHNDKLVTFLDTPGHEAFTAMRARGAQITDIAILVIASDDGMMPQTIEALDHVRAANVPIIIAVTKIDIPNSDIDKVYRQLSEHNLLVEAWGGDTIAIPLSGITGEGINDLLENLQIVAELGELKANPDRIAKGVVVEARLEKSRGPVATILIQTGTLKQGDSIVMGSHFGRIRAMFDDQGERIKIAGPSSPVEIMGLNEVPEAGILFDVVENEKEAKKLVENQKALQRQESISLQDVHMRSQPGEIRQVDLIIKTDVQGSIDAIKNALENLNSSDSKVNIIHIASGGISERDVLLAVASQAIIIGFNSNTETGADSLAKQENIEIRQYDVIYHLVEDIEKALAGMLEPEFEEQLIGRASVRAIFNLGRHRRIAGIYVSDGKLIRDASIHVFRNGSEIFVGNLTSLKHFKDDVREVATGFEGGISLDGFDDFKEDDILEAYTSVQIN